MVHAACSPSTSARQAIHPCRRRRAPAFNAPPGAHQQEVKQTATIRNAVNLKKFTLKLVSVEGQPNKLSVRFQVDASEPFV